MRTTRLMTWFFLALSLALLCVRGFRPALEAPLTLLLPEYWTGEYGGSAWAKNISSDLDERNLQVGLISLGTGRILDHFFTLQRYATPTELRRMAHDAEQGGDAEFMAFAALHLPEKEMRGDVLQLTDRAVASNPKLTWLIYYVAARYDADWGSEPLAKDWRVRVEKLEAWDPDNAAPHILRANIILGGSSRRGKGGASNPSKIQDDLTQHLGWQKEMETAFGRPRYDSYTLPRFQLERHVMMMHGWTDPLVMRYTLGGGIPGLFTARNYAKLLAENIGKEAEEAGRIEDALHDYRIVARFGERLRLQNHTLIEQLVGISIQRIAYQRLVPALNKAGKTDEAAAVDFAQKQLLSELDSRWKDPMSRTSNQTWSVVLTSVAGTAVWIFLFLSLVSVIYVNAKLVIRREKKGRLYPFMTVLENYAPVMLFSSCLALGLVYAPFAENFSSYMAASEPSISWDQFPGNSFPSLQSLGGLDLPIHNPYHGFVACTLALVGLMVLIAIVMNRLAARKKQA